MTWKEALAVFVAWLDPWLEKLTAYFAGRASQRAADSQATLKWVEAANRSAASVDLLDDDEVVSELTKRGLYDVHNAQGVR